MKTEFIPGRLYESLYTNTVVKCISDDGAYSFNFTGVVVSSSIEYPIGHEEPPFCLNVLSEIANP